MKRQVTKKAGMEKAAMSALLVPKKNFFITKTIARL